MKHEMKGKMNKFLDSFDEKVTMHTTQDQETHKSVEHLKGTAGPQSAPLSRYSTMTRDQMSGTALAHFDKYMNDGYCVIEDLFSQREIAFLQSETRRILDLPSTNYGSNSFYGNNTKRAYSLLAKTRALDPFLTQPILAELVDALHAPNPLLSALQLMEICPGEIAQKLHYDQQFSNIGAQTRGDDCVVNIIVAIDDFTADNGATVIIPGSHAWSGDRVPQPSDLHMPVVMKAGSCCLFSGNLWHGGGANNTQKSRRGFIMVFTQPWLRTLENHFLSIPFTTVAHLAPRIQSVLGYSLHHPFVGQVDFGHPLKKLNELAANEEARDKELAKAKL